MPIDDQHVTRALTELVDIGAGGKCVSGLGCCLEGVEWHVELDVPPVFFRPTRLVESCEYVKGSRHLICTPSGGLLGQLGESLLIERGQNWLRLGTSRSYFTYGRSAN